MLLALVQFEEKILQHFEKYKRGVIGGGLKYKVRSNLLCLKKNKKK